MCNSFTNSYFPYAIKKWDSLDHELKYEPDFTLFKLKLKEKLKPQKFKHFNCGFKYQNSLHTQLRVGRSFLNSHMYEIGQSQTKSCQQYTYGGCLGNNNRYESKQECEAVCVEETAISHLLIGQCEQPIKPGPCSGNFTRYVVCT